MAYCFSYEESKSIHYRYIVGGQSMLWTWISCYSIVWSRQELPLWTNDICTSSTTDLQYHNPEDYVIQLVERLKLAHAAVNTRVEQAQANRDQQNLSLKDVTVHDIGSKVMLFTPKVKSGNVGRLKPYLSPESSSIRWLAMQQN